MEERNRDGVYYGVGKNNKSIYKVEDGYAVDVYHPEHVEEVVSRHRKRSMIVALMVILLGTIAQTLGLIGGITPFLGVIAYLLTPIIGMTLTYQNYRAEAERNNKYDTNYFVGMDKVLNYNRFSQTEYLQYFREEDRLFEEREKSGDNYIRNKVETKSETKSETKKGNNQYDDKIFQTGVDYSIESLKTLYITKDNELLFAYETIDIEESVKKGYIVKNTKNLKLAEDVDNRIAAQAMEMYRKNDVLPDDKIESLMRTYETICYHKSSKLVHESYQNLLDKKTEVGHSYINKLLETEQNLIEELNQLKLEGKNNIEQNKAIINSIKVAS